MRLLSSRTRFVPCAPEQVFACIDRIGGRTGWYFANFLWRLRGWLDLLVGGVGLRRGRDDPEHLRLGDAVDCWRVETLEAGRMVRLRAEMTAPGRGWLQFEVTPAPGGALLHQTALFEAQGVGGLLYWFGLGPVHHLLFSGMIRRIARAATRAAATTAATAPPGTAQPAGRAVVDP